MKNRKTLCLIMGDQLNLGISSLQAIDKHNSLIVMAELWDEARYVKHHQKKLVLVLSAMRHFQKMLIEQGYEVLYFKLDDKVTYASFTEVITACLKAHQIDQITLTHPGEYRVFNEVKRWKKTFNIPVEIVDDNRFLTQPEDFTQWAQGRKQLRMEYFYRELRKRFCILMDKRKPVGGKWNYDADNRNPPNKNLTIPKSTQFAIDDITAKVIALVKKQFATHFGDIEPFNYAVTLEQALQVVTQFINERLRHFGTYQDAMLEDEPWMFHAHISFYLNCGLLMPLECLQKAEAAYHTGKAPLNAVEGFIRQILGWREYVHGFYWYAMPRYKTLNFFNAKRALPALYWGADTAMNCLKQCVKDTRQHAYAHHIQRLMVLGNFALLTGIDPKAVNEWFMIVYADAYEWVELPNVSGMTLFADGGLLASKPYAAGGSYLHKMSNYCEGCSFDVKQKTGPQACPFNYLYWDFLVRHRDKLNNNARLTMIYKTWDKMHSDKKTDIITSAKAFLQSSAMSEAMN